MEQELEFELKKAHTAFVLTMETLCNEIAKMITKERKVFRHKILLLSVLIGITLIALGISIWQIVVSVSTPILLILATVALGGIAVVFAVIMASDIRQHHRLEKKLFEYFDNKRAELKTAYEENVKKLQQNSRN